jgi:para-aminobenzoate synthetase/4-amino-4-deoxychorismate lyase
MSNHDEWNRAVLALAGRTDYFLLETNLVNDTERHNYLFLEPEDIVTISAGEDTGPAFERLEAAVNGGLYAAGYFAYELGYCLEDKFDPPGAYPLPLLHMGLYRDPYIFDAAAGKWLHGRAPQVQDPPPPPPDFAISDPVLNETWPVYKKNIEEVKHRIELGDTYQINYTLRINFDLHGDPLGLYLHLRNKQKVSYSGILRSGDASVLTLSPELFFRVKGGAVEVRPMKGTAPRGKDSAEDESLKDFLHNDVKNRAENVMIVDLLRNDLGRVSVEGSVNVPSLFDVEPYETLYQMTSTVKSELKPDVSLRKLFASIFPSGSVTGAPKISSMQIIRELESAPRGVYTGSVGFIGPEKKDMVFNVAIRTVASMGGEAEMGIGGGIIYDSEPDSEWKEALLKGNFLLGALGEIGPREFSLIETMLWSRERGYFLAQLHLERLMFSADHFGFACDVPDIGKRLAEYAAAMPEGAPPQRVRLLLQKDGTVSIEHSAIEPDFSSTLPWCTISSLSTLSYNEFLRHKTTVREFYNKAYRAFYNAGYTDLIFMNERGELTEGCITNLILEIGGERFTPPLHSGVLDGVMRRHLLQDGQIRERILYPEDLGVASRVFLCNSVRGVYEVTMRIPRFLSHLGISGFGSCGH